MKKAVQYIRGLAFASVLVVITTTGVAEAQQLWVPNYEGHDVTVLDANTLAHLATVPLAPPISDACPDQDPDNGPESPDGLAGQPNAVALTEDTTKAFVTLDDCNQVAVISTADFTVQYIEVPPADQETRVFVHGDFAYVNTCAWPTVAVINVNTLDDPVVTLPGDGGTYPMGFADGIGYAGNGLPDALGLQPCERHLPD
jgi:DNA-binding beta-propeller fold protein YncE